MSNWVRLGDISSITEGYKQKMSSEYVARGIPFLRSLNIRPFRVILDDLKFVTQEFSTRLNKSMLQKNDVLVVRTGIPGTSCVVPDSLVGANCSDLLILRVDKTRANPLYVSAFINVLGKAQVNNSISGAVQKHLYLHAANDLRILLPRKSEQDSIAKLVSDLNEKIETNNQVNDNLVDSLEIVA